MELNIRVEGKRELFKEYDYTVVISKNEEVSIKYL